VRVAQNCITSQQTLSCEANSLLTAQEIRKLKKNHEGSFVYSQGQTTGPYHEPTESALTLKPHSFKTRFNIVRLPKYRFSK
jgi:hypothetical protein